MEGGVVAVLSRVLIEGVDLVTIILRWLVEEMKEGSSTSPADNSLLTGRPRDCSCELEEKRECIAIRARGVFYTCSADLADKEVIEPLLLA